MEYFLVTDGKLWAIKRTSSILKIVTVFHINEYDTITWLKIHSNDINFRLYFKECWMDKEKAEMWYKRFTS
jgi:hypothetical protein